MRTASFMGRGGWLALWVLAWSAPVASAQNQQPTVRVTLSTGIAKLGEQIEMRIEVNDGNRSRIVRLPEVEGLEMLGVSAPASTSFERRINGVNYRRTTTAWVVPIRPLKVGEYEIPPVELEVDGRIRRGPESAMILKVVKDLEGAELGFIDMVGMPESVYEGQPFNLDLRFGWSKDMNLATAGLRLPWWNSLPGILEVRRPPDENALTPKEIAVNRAEKVRVEQLGDIQKRDREFHAFRLRRRLLASRPGTLRFPQSTFEFGERVSSGRGFQPDVFRDYYANLAPFEVEVLPVPEEGRPFEWTGAVGPLTAEREVDRRDVDAGDSIRFEVRWRGEANVEFFDLPDPQRMDAFRGFRVLGVQDDFDALERRAIYDLVPMDAALTEIPSLPLHTFDTNLGKYVRVETRPVPIRVRPVAGVGPLVDGDEAAEVFDIRDVQPPVPRGSAIEPPERAWLWLAILGVPAVWWFGRGALRRKLGDPAGPRQRRRRHAPGRLRRELTRARGARDQARGLYGFLAARTGEAESAWVGRDLFAWRAERPAGPDEESLRELQQVLEELEERAWAGSDQPLEPGRVRGVAERVMREGL